MSDLRALVAKIRGALCDPLAPWYGSALVPWVDDALRELGAYEDRRICTKHREVSVTYSGRYAECPLCKLAMVLNDAAHELLCAAEVAKSPDRALAELEHAEHELRAAQREAEAVKP